MQLIPLLLLVCGLPTATPQFSQPRLTSQIHYKKVSKNIIIDFQFDLNGCHYEVFAVWSSESGGSGSISQNCGGRPRTIHFILKKPPTVYFARLQSGDIVSTQDSNGNPVEVNEAEKDMWISQINENWPTEE